MTDDAAGPGEPDTPARVSAGANPGGEAGWDHPRLQREVHLDLTFGELLQLMVLMKREIAEVGQQQGGDEAALRLARLLWKLEESEGGPDVGHSKVARPPEVVP